MTRRRRLLAIWVALFACYAALAVSPAPDFVARSHLALASAFSPPLFNASWEYETGDVLDFRIGMTRQQFVETLVANYSGKGEVLIDCRVVTAASLVSIAPGLEPSSDSHVYLDICLRLGKKLGMRAFFANDSLKRIELWYVNNEMA